MALTPQELAPLAASAKTEIDRVIALPSPTVGEITAAQADGFDDSSVGYATLRELLNAKHSGYDLGITTFDDLDTHIQVYIDNSALLNADNLQLLRFITMPSRIRAVHEDDPQQFNTSQTITVPADCYLLKVSFQAKGGDSGESQAGGATNSSGGGGGGGGYVNNYEIVTTPGNQFVLTFGDTLTLGPLTVEAGGNGNHYYQTPKSGGDAGRVLWNGQEVDDGITCVSGTVGMSGTLAIAPIESARPVTSNGNRQGEGGGYYNTGNAQYYGAGGGACGSNPGEDKMIGTTVGQDTRPSLLGAGASSPNAQGGSNIFAQAQPGGARSPFVIINFVKQQP